MSIVLVSKNQYLIAKQILHITLDEQRETFEYRLNGKWNDKLYDKYVINITFVPDYTNPHNSRGEEVRDCNIVIRNKVAAYKIYHDLIQQVREQMPDQLFLDKAVENLISLYGAELVEMASETSEGEHDRSTEEIRRVRKAKRTSKKVLRRSKKGN